MKAKDITNQRFGHLVALRETKNEAGEAVWECKCDCGNIVYSPGYILRQSGPHKSCGCISKYEYNSKNTKVLTVGQKFHMLTVVEKISNTKYKFKCDCGKIIELNSYKVLNNNNKSCGCFKASKKVPDGIAARSNIPDNDWINTRHGDLLVLEVNSKLDEDKKLFKCRCFCGREIIVSKSHLIHGIIKNCGCGGSSDLKNTLADNRNYGVNVRYGKLVTVKLIKREDRFDWVCKCDCGNTIIARRSHLRLKKVTECDICATYNQSKLRRTN